MSDSISNFLTIIRNAYSARKDTCTARFSTPVTPDGTQMTIRGFTQREALTFWMK